MGGAAAPAAMGYQPALDGLRAVSVLAVIAYHADAPWMTGGFFGVEVFFVVSGYLITTLLLEERERTGKTDLVHFWMRRGRRLLPALFVMLATIAAWVAVFGAHEQQATLRRDLPWSLFYVNNWGQIVGDTPYFASTDPPLLRHLWSLAVEEQWYLVWPLVFVALAGLRRARPDRTGTSSARTSRVGAGLIGVSMAVMVLTAFLHGTVADNTLYLSTPSRSSGLLLGAGAAFVWQPWRPDVGSSSLRRSIVGVVADTAGVLALVVLALAMVNGTITAPSTYHWALALVSTASIVVVGCAVTPGATVVRSALSWRPLVAVGHRSYGLYLWHWPVLVLAGATGGTSTGVNGLVRVGAALAVAVGLNELAYRYVEMPARRWRPVPTGGRHRSRWRVAVVGAAATAVAAGLTLAYVAVEPYDPAVGTQAARFDDDTVAGLMPGSVPTATVPEDAAGPATSAAGPVVDAPASTTGAAPTTAMSPVITTSTELATTTTVATLPRRLVIVGDSQAHSFVVNLPSGFDDYFVVTDGAVDGCGVHDAGEVRSSLVGFGRDFAECAGWPQRWADAAERADADVALVMLGAWDVFDLLIGDAVIEFGSAAGDALWSANVTTGIDALAARGVQVALLEVPCMRPVENSGARVPPLPERGDDVRTEHLNVLLRQIALERDDVWFIEGPDEWCDDQSISTDVDYRWDGVHVYQQGAGLIAGTIALPLLQIPVPT